MMVLSKGFIYYFRAVNIIAGVSLLTTFFLCFHINNLQNELDRYQLQFHGQDSSFEVYKDELTKYRISVEKEKKERILQKYRHVRPEDVNITKPDAKLTLMFNRVPKVGSQSMMSLMKSLSYANGFTYHKDRAIKSEVIKLTEREQSRLVKLIDIFHPPTIYVKHVCYINFTEFNVAPPIYINMVRDPVERVISWYYYVRAPWYYVERKNAFPFMKMPTAAWLKKDFETCVRNSDPECTYQEGDQRPDFAQLTEFFCGQEDNCTGLNTEYALNKAKENVEKYYAVVGVLEEMDMSLTVFENYLPRFFENATNTYNAQKKEFSQVNQNIYKPSVSEEIKNIVRKNFTREIEFYEFCKQRLYKQYAALRLSTEHHQL